MMEEIITLIIHEATGREGTEMGYKLREVLVEVTLCVDTMLSDLFKVEEMEIDEVRKAEMRTLVLTSHKT